MTQVRGRPSWLLAPLLAVVLIWCAPARAQDDQDDPFEPVNRAIFKFNVFMDDAVLVPVARFYRFAAPDVVRTGIENFLANLRTPIVLVNDVLQGNAKRAEHTLGRFMLNTVLGIGGFIDIGGIVGMPDRHNEDFGQTLGAYGVDPGPYLMLPLLGPSNPRDAVGRVTDLFFDPLTYLGAADIGIFINPTAFGLIRYGAETISFRERNLESIEELKRSSIDYYAAVRSLYRQFRANEIRNGAPPPLEDIYNEDVYDLEDPEDANVE